MNKEENSRKENSRHFMSLSKSNLFTILNNNSTFQYSKSEYIKGMDKIF